MTERDQEAEFLSKMDDTPLEELEAGRKARKEVCSFCNKPVWRTENDYPVWGIYKLDGSLLCCSNCYRDGKHKPETLEAHEANCDFCKGVAEYIKHPQRGKAIKEAIATILEYECEVCGRPSDRHRVLVEEG